MNMRALSLFRSRIVTARADRIALVRSDSHIKIHTIVLAFEKFLGAAIYDDPTSAQGVASGNPNGTRPQGQVP
jgi:hypothetical protein